MQRTQNLNPPEATPAPSEERKGSILVIVIALLGMLLLLGIAFYSFAAQEHVSAGYFAETYKERLPGISAEVLFDYGLEQLIVGPSSTQTQSALYGKSHSLIGNMLGLNANSISGGFFDPVPYNGPGINLALNGTNGPIVDLDYDGTADADQTPLTRLNFSAAANGTPVDPYSAVPQPDAGYTYPDINSLYLSYLSEPMDDVNGKRVIIPSFFRPQLLRDSSGAISATWYEDAGLGTQLLRPHPDHLIAGSATKRFIGPAETPPNNVLGNSIGRFPWAVDSLTNPNTTLGELGVWTGGTDDDYDLDTDNDNDGTKEGIWLDLGFPAQTLVDGRRYVPLFSFTVQDADGLINLNTAGNFNQLLDGTNDYGDASLGAMQNIPISTSNLGVSRTEVNPLWALWGWSASASNPSYPSLSAGQQNEFKYFTNVTGSMTRTAIANMEFIHIKNGQKRDDGTGGDEYNVGAWGELATLQAGGISSPGMVNYNDDFDFDSSTSKAPGSPYFDPLLQIISTINFPAVGTPLDLRGFGSFTVTGTNGLVANLNAGTAGDPNRWLKFTNYLDDSEWSTTMSGNLASPFIATSSQIDEADETIVEPLLTNVGGQIGSTIQADSIYGADEMLGLHITNSEYTSVAGTSRLRKLAPINFSDEAIRKQFTTTSFDRAEFSWLPSVKRSWEVNTSDVLFQYSNDPFRTELRNLLSIPHRYRLTLNGLLTGINSNNRPVYQSLTPYPSNYSTPTAAAQLAQATADRISLARDLYCLLYSVGGGLDIDCSATSGSTLYNSAQLAEMAQFAVNIVDAMDRDNVITEFAYDTDLSDGWSPSTSKVYGVEAQELTLSEWLAVRIPYAGTGNNDHPVTRYDDSSLTLDPVGTIWAYIELKSVSPHPVALDGWGWRIRKEGIGGTRYLTLHGGTGTEVPPGGTYLIGSTSQPELNTATSKCYSSDLRIDYDKNTITNPNSFNRILPRDIETTESAIPSPTNIISPAPASDLDLVYDYQPSDTPNDKFIVSSDASATPGPLGDFFNPSSIPNSAGTEKVRLILERRSNLQAIVNQGVDDPDNPWIAVDQMVIEPPKAVYTINLDFANNLNDTENVMRFTGGTSGNGKLRDFVSYERKEPLDRSEAAAEDDSTAGTGGTAGVLDFSPNSTLNATNSISPTAFTLWQSHFDREFSSAFELLSIPLYGPPESSTLSFDVDGDPVDSGSVANYSSYLLNGVTTNRLKQSQDMTNTLLSVSSPPMGLEDEYRGVELVAAKKFLRPDYDDDADVTKAKFDNRWYRFLDLVQVPTLTNHVVQWEHDGVYGVQWPDVDFPSRLPGAINLNTVRHRGVLASLIDDSAYHHTSAYTSPATMLDDQHESRDWWTEMIKSRDQIDPATSLILPGLPNSNPYRFQGIVDHINEDVNGNGLLDMGEDVNMNLLLDFVSPNVLIGKTLLRDLSLDGPMTPDRRNLFEARGANDLASSMGPDPNRVDYHTRHRLLRKIANNSTNRSNVFIVWMSVGYFEAVDDSASGSVRIGAPFASQPEHRGFFIVDRTLLEKAEVENSTNGRRFDFKKFITYKKTLK